MNRFPLVLVLVTAGSWFAGNPLVALAVTAGSGLLYVLSLRRNPWRPCHKCGGSKSHRDRLWGYASGRCTRCDGEGRFVRWGVRVLTPGRAKELTSGQYGRYG